jgi:hypothetical protein
MLYRWSKDEHVYVDHIHHPWFPSDIILSHDLRLNVGFNFTYATNTILGV